MKQGNNRRSGQGQCPQGQSGQSRRPHFQRRWVRTGLLRSSLLRFSLLGGLLLLGLAPAQRTVSIYGGSFTGDETIKIEVSAPTGTTFTLRRVLDPAGLFLATRDPRRPQLAPGAPTQLVRTLTLGRRAGGTVQLGRLPSGVYLLGTGNLSAVVLVSNLGLVVKRDRAVAQTYAADRSSGRTRAARVWALPDRQDGNRQAAVSALADRDGLARFQKAQFGEKATFLARFGNDWAVSGSDWNSYAAPKVRGYVYTDRPVYRPGQRVEFKAVLRQAGSLKPLANTSVRVRVTSQGDEVYRGALSTNALGSLGAGLDLSAGARLGQYDFELIPDSAGEDGQRDITGSFQVEAYQKPEYAVSVTPEKRQAVQGEKLSVRVSARYLFGGTLSGARINYNVTRAPYYAPGFDEGSLGPDTDEGSDYGSDLVIQAETRLDNNGDLVLQLPLARDEDGDPVSYRIEAEVEDESRRTVSARSQVIAYPASLNVEASTDGYVYDVNKPITVSLETRDLKSVGRAAPVALELIREDYAYNTRTKKWVYSEAVLARSSARTGPNGLVSAVLRAPRSGGYRLRATVQDSQGRRSRSENFVWVLGSGESLSWNYRDMTLKLNRKSYAPGETATLLIGNPAPGSPVLVTLEGDRLRKSVVLRSAGAALTYDFPVTADMAPNITVTATSLGGGQLYSGQATVKVPRRSGQLAVKVTPGKARYAPGDTGRLSVDVTAPGGQGTAAEVALGVVDGAIYLVQRDTATPIAQVFDRPQDNVVGTSSSLNFYFSQVGDVAGAPRPALSQPAFAQAKESRAADAASADTVTPRQDFKDTILWLPNLITDAGGHAEVEFKFPDNLTTWVATARAQSADVTGPARFGQSTASTMTTKDVIARLSLPPFLVRGDTATLSGIVNNTLIVPVAGRANASLSGLNPLSGAALTPAGTALSVAAESRSRADMQVQAARVGQASVTFTARTASGSDALKLPLPVKARGTEVTQTAVGSAGAAAITLNIPSDANLSTLNLNLSLTPSLLSAVAPALEYLVGYPYGCTEQTMSRFLPALLARQTLGSAGLPESVTKNLNDITSSGLARLQLFQHGDGGWNFWQYDDSTLEMSAYVTQGLLRAKALGTKVDNGMLDSALKYLAKTAARSSERQADRAGAYRALASAGRVDPEQLLAFSRRRDLEPYALANTALALSQIGQRSLARDTLDRLKARRIGTGGGLIHWEKPKNAQSPAWYDYWDDNSIQVTAAALEALAKLDPGSPLIAPTSQWLLRARRGPQWLSTQDTTSVIVAALALKPGPVIKGEVGVLLDGKVVGSATLDDRGAVSLKLDTAGLKAGSHTLSVQGARLPAGLTYSSALTFSREQAQLRGDSSQGLMLSRRYDRLDSVWDEKAKRYTYRRTALLKGGQLQPVTTGDLILVTLSVQPKDHSARYLLISDPIPAGMKALDERSLAIAGLPDPDENDWESWNYWYAGRELLDDRVDLYADYLSGRKTVTYLLRAQTPGTFTALPTHAFLMYDPEVEGYGPAATLTVRDRGQ